MPDATQEPTHPSPLKLIGTASAGTLLEYYDFFVYVSLTSVLTRLFLPDTDPTVAALLAVATFGVSYCARPIGTLIFNPLADRRGRKKMLVVTLILMGGSTVALGCLPTYEHVGVIAPAALLLLRVIQGVALGGEYGPAVVFVVEHAPANRRGLFTSFLQGTAAAGLLLSLLVVLGLQHSLSASQFETWGWRIPFLLSAPIVAIALVSRTRVRESPVFERMRDANETSSRPLRETLGSMANWRGILLGMFGAQGGTSVSLYTSIVFMLVFLDQVVKVPALTGSACVAAAIVVSLPCYPLFGRVSDSIGRARVMLIGTVAWLILAYPCFKGIKEYAQDRAWVATTLLIAVLAVLTAMIMAPLPSFIAERFPPQQRTTGFGLAQQLGNLLFGGFLPLISLSLVEATGNDLAGVLYSIGSLLPCAIVTAVWGLRSEEVSRRSGIALQKRAPMSDALN